MAAKSTTHSKGGHLLRIFGIDALASDLYWLKSHCSPGSRRINKAANMRGRAVVSLPHRARAPAATSADSTVDANYVYWSEGHYIARAPNVLAAPVPPDKTWLDIGTGYAACDPCCRRRPHLLDATPLPQWEKPTAPISIGRASIERQPRPASNMTSSSADPSSRTRHQPAERNRLSTAHSSTGRSSLRRSGRLAASVAPTSTGPGSTNRLHPQRLRSQQRRRRGGAGHRPAPPSPGGRPDDRPLLRCGSSSSNPRTSRSLPAAARPPSTLSSGLASPQAQGGAERNCLLLHAQPGRGRHGRDEAGQGGPACRARSASGRRRATAKKKKCDLTRAQAVPRMGKEGEELPALQRPGQGQGPAVGQVQSRLHRQRPRGQTRNPTRSASRSSSPRPAAPRPSA